MALLPDGRFVMVLLPLPVMLRHVKDSDNGLIFIPGEVTLVFRLGLSCPLLFSFAAKLFCLHPGQIALLPDCHFVMALLP